MLKHHAHKKLIMSWKFEDSVAKQNPTGLFTAYKRIAHKKCNIFVCLYVYLLVNSSWSNGRISYILDTQNTHTVPPSPFLLLMIISLLIQVYEGQLSVTN